MTLNEYLELPDTPMAESPVAKMMVRILAEYPLQVSTKHEFDDIRRQALESLATASGKKTYAPMTPSQSQRARLAIRNRMRKK
jgi:hypothetical protein